MTAGRGWSFWVRGILDDLLGAGFGHGAITRRCAPGKLRAPKGGVVWRAGGVVTGTGRPKRPERVDVRPGRFARGCV